MGRSRVTELALPLSARVHRSRLCILVTILLVGLLVSSSCCGGHMSDSLSKGLGLLLLRDLSLLLLLLLKDVVDLALLPGLVLDPEHGRPLALVDIVIAEVAARLEFVSPVILNLEQLSLVLFHEP
jgi:hypothetical protein